MRMKLSDIKIREDFANSTPRKEKIENCRNHWNAYHTQDRDIVVNKRGVLLDGYVQYLVLKEEKIDEVCVKVYGDAEYHEPITYVFGTHFNGNGKKEYTWRVPKAWGRFRRIVRPGDHIQCSTANGIQTIVVTRVEKLCDPPVNGKIRRVKKDEIVRNGQLLK